MELSPRGQNFGNSARQEGTSSVTVRNQPQNPFIPFPAPAQSLTCNFSRNLAGCPAGCLGRIGGSAVPGARSFLLLFFFLHVSFFHGCESFLTSNPWGVFLGAERPKTCQVFSSELLWDVRGAGWRLGKGESVKFWCFAGFFFSCSCCSLDLVLETFTFGLVGFFFVFLLFFFQFNVIYAE